MVMGSNGGVRQHLDENNSDVCKWNPLGLQKWLQILGGVVSSSCVQMIEQYRDPEAWDGDGPGRRGGQTLGIP